MNNEEKILEMLLAQGDLLAKLSTDITELKGTVQELDERSLRSAVLLEGEIAPKVQLLFEGQKNLQETLAPKDRMEVLEDEVITLKTVVKSMSKRLAALEKAQ